jgi:hypothetical protein
MRYYSDYNAEGEENVVLYTGITKEEIIIGEEVSHRRRSSTPK